MTRSSMRILEGGSVRAAPAPVEVQGAVSLPGKNGSVPLTEEVLSRHVLFVGGIGVGKTNAMMHVVRGLRQRSDSDDVFVIFDTKGDYRAEFLTSGDAVIENSREPGPNGVVWNIFADLFETDPEVRGDEILELAGTIFADQASNAGENLYFALAARDVFAGVVDALARDNGVHSNADLRRQLEAGQEKLLALFSAHEDLRGVRNYLTGSGNTPLAVLAFMQQTVKSTFSGAFRQAGEFSVREFVRRKGGRALFVEYDIAAGTLLLPIYRVLIDLAVKEGLSRARTRGNVFFIFDEFSLLPQLRHVADGINFGRALGLKFVVGTQSVSQVYHAYGDAVANSILGGFGTVVGFRVNDDRTRNFIKERHGRNRKLIATEHAVRTQGVQHDIIDGSVVEDWDVTGLAQGQAIVALPEAMPFLWAFPRFDAESRGAQPHAHECADTIATTLDVGAQPTGVDATTDDNAQTEA